MVERSASELFAGTHMDWATDDAMPADALDARFAAGDIWIAEDGGPVAFLVADRIDAAFFILEVAVARSHQRRGIGARLIETALAEAKRRGHVAATLTTDRTLPWNAPYYARLGFRTLMPGEMSPGLAARLASEPSPDRRCAMIRTL